MRKPCRDQDTSKEIRPDDPGQAPDPVAAERSSTGDDVADNEEEPETARIGEHEETEEKNPLDEIFKDPLTEMAEKEEERRRKLEEDGFLDDEEDAMRATAKDEDFNVRM